MLPQQSSNWIAGGEISKNEGDEGNTDDHKDKPDEAFYEELYHVIVPLVFSCEAIIVDRSAGF